MRIPTILLLLIIFAARPAVAQKERVLKGNVMMGGVSNISYYIYFKVRNNRITGYSITQNPGTGPLKASLDGRFSQDGQVMELRETGSLDRDADVSYFCFFDAQLRLTERDDKKIWSGTFSSYSPTGQPCEGGLMTFIDVTDSQPQPPAEKQPDPVVVAPPPKPDTPPPPPAPKPVLAVVDTAVKSVLRTVDTTGLKPLYNWNSETVGIDIWDGWDNDGDRVDVLVDGKLVLENITLSAERRHFSFPLPASGIITVSIKILAEGNVPPGTPRLVLHDGAESRELNISGTVGQTANLYFRRSSLK